MEMLMVLFPDEGSQFPCSVSLVLSGLCVLETRPGAVRRKLYCENCRSFSDVSRIEKRRPRRASGSEDHLLGEAAFSGGPRPCSSLMASSRLCPDCRAEVLI